MVDLVVETARAKSIVLDLPGWRGRRAGQHVDIRLTAEDGYQAQRSYSIASAPEDDLLALTIARLDDGEVSPYLTDVLELGDELELRGPIGGYFVWEASLPGPLQLIAGGSGIVPLRAMLRHWVATDRPVAARLLYSARSLDDAIFREELLGLAVYAPSAHEVQAVDLAFGSETGIKTGIKLSETEGNSDHQIPRGRAK